MTKVKILILKIILQGRMIKGITVIHTNGLSYSDLQNGKSNISQSENSNKAKHTRLLSPTLKQQREKISKSKFHTDIISQWVQINTTK